MTVVAKCLAEGVQVPASNSTLYTAPASTRTIIDKCTATNTTGGAVTLTFNVVPSAGAAGVSNAVISAQSIAAGVDYLCPEVVGQILNPGDFLSAVASAATSITVRVSGREVS